ncbi:hypothetical protein jhhlp_000521 [Lomentospora prolificans]|uniref:Alcohol dehydrogenase-like N-terminal domain-containing protein n=1 Tax=Lomentospora prolificans TaxID=41688 RepID=A0A2N3NL67_9PEZI|nr:hypothetical protein jhhlp_000521 [Lomentospora prolificans]
MPVRKYTYKGPVDHTLPIDRSQAKGKSIIVTGGANGMGESCVRAFVAAGAFVTFADVNERGYEVEKELTEAHGNCCKFVKCDITSWEGQKNMFETAKKLSPANSIDVVLANAGISRSSGDNPNDEPQKPALNILNTNLTGSLYTFKLAVHYFRKQPDTEKRDRCFIITGSLNGGWVDSPGNWEYTAAKYALHGFTKVVRRSSPEQGIRIVYVAPCWIRSAIRPPHYEKWLMDQGVEFGEQEDVANCMMRIACDKSLNGQSFQITPRSVAKEGFMDIDRDDYKDRPEDAYFKAGHQSCGRIVKLGDQVKDFQIGDVVAMLAVPGCGASDCPECTRDKPQLCERSHHSGISQDSFHAQYAAIDQRGLVRVPKGVTSSEAAIACDAITTVYHAVKRRAEVQASHTVFLFGLGGLGFNVLQAVHNIGARVIVSDIR